MVLAGAAIRVFQSGTGASQSGSDTDNTTGLAGYIMIGRLGHLDVLTPKLQNPSLNNERMASGVLCRASGIGGRKFGNCRRGSKRKQAELKGSKRSP